MSLRKPHIQRQSVPKHHTGGLTDPVAVRAPQRHLLDQRRSMVACSKPTKAGLEIAVASLPPEVVGHHAPGRESHADTRTVEVKVWLAAKPRIHPHFTPTSASWLNLVEVWFGSFNAKQSAAAPSPPWTTSPPRSAPSSPAGTTAQHRSSGPRHPKKSWTKQPVKLLQTRTTRSGSGRATARRLRNLLARRRFSDGRPRIWVIDVRSPPS